MSNKLSVALLSLLALVFVSSANAEVARTVITTAIVDREPVDDLTTVPASDSSAIFFTELSNMEGTTITHLWKFNGEVMAEVKFNVGGPRWRVWSSKNLMPEWNGEWNLEVLDDSGSVVAQKSFTYGAVAEGAPKGEMSDDAPMAEQSAAPAEEMKQ